MTLEEFVSSFNPELVGGRFIGAVDGARHFVAEFVDGVFTITEEGKKLIAQAEQGEADVIIGDTELTVNAPRRRGRPPVQEAQE